MTPRGLTSRGIGQRVTLSRALPVFFVSLALLVAVGCDFDTAAKKTIFGLNEVQDGAFNALKEARAKTIAAGLACGEAARAAVPPVNPSPEACAALGHPIPFDPAKVNDAISVSNAAYEAIRGANSARLALKDGSGSKGDVLAAVGHALDALIRLGAAVREAGVEFDDTELRKLNDYWNGRI